MVAVDAALTADLNVGRRLPGSQDGNLNPSVLARLTVGMSGSSTAVGGKAASAVPSATAAKRQPEQGWSLATTLPARNERGT